MSQNSLKWYSCLNQYNPCVIFYKYVFITHRKCMQKRQRYNLNEYNQKGLFCVLARSIVYFILANSYCISFEKRKLCLPQLWGFFLSIHLYIALLFLKLLKIKLKLYQNNLFNKCNWFLIQYFFKKVPCLIRDFQPQLHLRILHLSKSVPFLYSE